MYFEENKYIKINLVGNRHFEINKYEIEKNVSNENVIKIKDKTKIGIDIDILKNENSLKGIFVKNMLQKIESETEHKEELLKAMEIGLNAM